MAENNPSIPFNHIRRSDRAVEDAAWIQERLHKAAVGTLALADGDQPYVNTNLFVYDEVQNAIYIHTAKKGRTRKIAESNANSCFTVFDMGRLLPADVALEFSVEYSSVVLFGPIHIVEDEQQAARALQALLDKYFPHLQPDHDYRAPVPAELKMTSVFRLDIESWSGKEKKVGEDFPGAFFYGEPPL